MPTEVIDESWVAESAEMFARFSNERCGIYPTIHAWFGGAMNERRRLREAIICHLEAYEEMLDIIAPGTHQEEVRKAIDLLQDSPMSLVLGDSA